MVTALLPPATLHGTFYPDPPSTNFRVEFIIVGPDVNKVSGDISSAYTVAVVTSKQDSMLVQVSRSEFASSLSL